MAGQLKPKIVKKTKGSFNRFQSDRFHRVKSNWRKVNEFVLKKKNI